MSLELDTKRLSSIALIHKESYTDKLQKIECIVVQHDLQQLSNKGSEAVYSS